jgi:phage baseplate assembly protein W
VRNCALVGFHYVTSWSLQLQVVASPLRTITLAVGGEISSLALLALITSQAQVHGELATFTAALVDGRVRLTLPANCTLTWVTTELRDLLRFTGATVAATSTGSEQMRGIYAPQYPATEDRPISRAARSVVYAHTTADVHHYGTRRHRSITLRASGHQRSGLADEWRALKLFWDDYIAPGAEVLWYPDLAESAAFNADSAPWGYHTVRIVAPSDFDPAQQVPGYYGLWSLGLDCVEI